MKLGAFESYYKALEYMAECAIRDRISYVEAHSSDERSRLEYKDLIEESLREIADFKKIQLMARNRIE